VKLLHVLNDGVAFSMFQGHRTPLIILQSILVAVIVSIMLIAYRRLGSAHHTLTIMTSFSLMLGGGLGNLWDRVSTGHVTDFVSIGSFAVFNVADACLVAGCGLLIIYMLRFAQNEEQPHGVQMTGGRRSGGNVGGDAADERPGGPGDGDAP
jgi:signal peptidase II